jgi:hypothetical protein
MSSPDRLLRRGAAFPRCSKIAAYAFFLIFKNIALTSDNLNAFSRWPWYSLSTVIR